MTNEPGAVTRLRRRQVLAALAGAPAFALCGPSLAATHDSFPEQVTLFVAGPLGGWLDSLSRTLASALRRYLPAGTTLGRAEIGGVDGVTGANQFAVQTSLDGSTALLLPGATPLAWLVGDTRVHFDPAHWLPVLARVGPAVVVGHADAAPLVRGAPVRVAGGRPADSALAAMLAYDVLGARVDPVFGLDDEKTALAALRANQVDAVLVRRPMTDLAGSLRPVFSFGLPQGDSYTRDPATPDVPTLIEYSATLGRPAPGGLRFDAWRCAAAAAQLRYALVLPSLTPASAVALWRQAGTQVLTRDGAAADHVVNASAASELMAAMTVSGPALLDLRGWMSSQLGWQPG
jgi:tripartite-type tricarboxylate transporter receptor subunit TctC